MAYWRYTCDIKRHFFECETEDDKYEDAKFIPSRDAVVAELKRARDYEDDWVLQVIVEDLANSEDVDEFNEWLSALYDWADSRRVWLGL